MFDPILHNPLINPLVNQTNYHNWIGGKSTPEGAILHWDADVDPFTEQTYNHHKFNYNVLSPQYQRNADGSYTNVGAKPAVDTFDGEKWLRSCGAVTNLLPSGAENFITGWNALQVIVSATGQVTSQGDAAYRVTATSTLAAHRVYKSTKTPFGAYTARLLVKKDTTRYCLVAIANQFEVTRIDAIIDFDLKTINLDTGTGACSLEEQSNGWFLVTLSGATIDGDTSASIFMYVFSNAQAPAFSGTVESVLVGSPQLTATAYPVPYVPPGVTQPASNATTTNGSWFTLPDGSPLWQALDGQAGEMFSGVQASNAYFETGRTQEELITNNYTRTTEWLSCAGLSAVTIDYTGVYATCTRCRVQTKNAGGTITYLASSPGDVTSGTGKFKFYIPIGAILFRVYFTNVSADVATLPIQRIQAQPLTLATRVRMGVGSADLLANAGAINHYISAGGNYAQYSYKGPTEVQVVTSFDGTTGVSAPLVVFPRNAVIIRITQVNTAGTQFRVGYMIEGTHTAIQWGSWAAFDGSFNPSTLYRLMLGYDNPYPMWYNKITAWKKQVTDAEILEAMA